MSIQTFKYILIEGFRGNMEFDAAKQWDNERWVFFLVTLLGGGSM